MINANELLKTKNYKFFFIKQKFSKIKIIRIASHINELKKINNHIIFLKGLGYKVVVNIMQNFSVRYKKNF